MTRILSYNILVGGTHRVDQLISIIRSRQPDIVGLIEAIDEQVVKDVAERLGMHYQLSGRAQDEEGWQAAILSRFSIVNTTIYSNETLTKQPLLEVTVQEPNGNPLSVFVTHLTADFGKGKAAYRARCREVQEILRIMASKQDQRHVLMGDFNSLAPGERLKGSSFLRYVIDPDLYYRLKPHESIQPPDLNFVLPPSLRFLKPLLEFVPRNKVFSFLLDSADIFYAPRGGIDLLKKAGYIDCFRTIHPDKAGFTWPAPMPSGRVDFIFANPSLAPRLSSSDVIVRGEDGISGDIASDHLPVFAEFGEDSEDYLKRSKQVKVPL